MRPGARINQLLNLELAHALYFKDGHWYHRLKYFPGALIDANGYLRFENESDYQACQAIRTSPFNDNLTIPNGIASIPGYRSFSDAELALLVQQDAILTGLEVAPTTEKALRKKRQIDAIVRNQGLVDDIKKLYKNTCQVCGERIQVRPGKHYSEVHHIRPLGQQHDGPDSKNNMLCVCPNHHAMLDFFSIRLTLGELHILKHEVNTSFIAYHNQRYEQFNITS
jgi:5-methylcytosine-specific restriction protein A